MNKKIVLIGAFIIFCFPAFAIDEVYTGFFSNKAVSGYDTVAFFTMNKAVKGKDKFKTSYKGKTWLFANRDHLKKFKKNPKKYAPQYGGYCGWRMAIDGEDISSDPEYWYIQDGKLYLNYDKDIFIKWKKDIPGFIKKANKNWTSIHGFKSYN